MKPKPPNRFLFNNSVIGESGFYQGLIGVVKKEHLKYTSQSPWPEVFYDVHFPEIGGTVWVESCHLKRCAK